MFERRRLNQANGAKIGRPKLRRLLGGIPGDFPRSHSDAGALLLPLTLRHASDPLFPQQRRADPEYPSWPLQGSFAPPWSMY